MDYTFATVIVPESACAQANELLGSSLFTVRLVPSAGAEVTHYIASGAFCNTELELILVSGIPCRMYFGTDVQRALHEQGLILESNEGLN